MSAFVSRSSRARMGTPRRGAVLAGWAIGAILLFAGSAELAPVNAQGTAPTGRISTDEIVQRLAPPDQPRTRSLSGSRTLRVEPREIDFQIGFDFDSASIRPESRGQLDDLVRAMNHDRLRPVRFRIEGHTDGAGTPSYNESLSQRRAHAVLDYLVARGVGHDRLIAEGKGMRELVDRDNPLSAANRRVRVVTRD